MGSPRLLRRVSLRIFTPSFALFSFFALYLRSESLPSILRNTSTANASFAVLQSSTKVCVRQPVQTPCFRPRRVTPWEEIVMLIDFSCLSRNPVSMSNPRDLTNSFEQCCKMVKHGLAALHVGQKAQRLISKRVQKREKVPLDSQTAQQWQELRETTAFDRDLEVGIAHSKQALTSTIREIIAFVADKPVYKTSHAYRKIASNPFFISVKEGQSVAGHFDRTAQPLRGSQLRSSSWPR